MSMPTSTPSPTTTTSKRGRGRPRKHPAPPPPPPYEGSTDDPDPNAVGLRFVDESRTVAAGRGDDDAAITRRVIRSHVMVQVRRARKAEREREREMERNWWKREGWSSSPMGGPGSGRYLPWRYEGIPTVSPVVPVNLCEFDDPLGVTNEFNEIRKHMTYIYSQSEMTDFGLSFAAQDVVFFNCLALVACAHLDALHGRRISAKALALKMQLTKLVNQNLSDARKSTSSENIAAVTALASAANTYDLGVGVEYFSHATGLEILVTTRGGLQTLHDNRFGVMVWKMIVVHNYVLTATFNLDIPLRDALLGDFEVDATKLHSPSSVIAESPFYCPRQDFVTLRRSALCTLATIRLVKDMYDYIGIVETESTATSQEEQHDIFSRRMVIRERLLGYPSVTSPETPARLERDFVYESMRLACLLLLRLCDTCLPVQIALAVPPPHLPAENSPVSLVSALVRAMQHTPLLEGWHDAIGCLSWVCLVGTCAARGKPEFAFLSSVGMRCMFDMCYENKDWSATIATLQRFIWLQRVLLSGRVRRVEDHEFPVRAPLETLAFN